MLALLLLNTVHFLSVHAQFLNGQVMQGFLYVSTRNVSYVPGDEIDDFPLDGGKAETWCAYRCLEASSCLMVDVCHFSTTTRCRLWRALPAQDLAGKTICRRFSATNSSLKQLDGSEQGIFNTISSASAAPLDQSNAESAPAECTYGCSCPEITPQISPDKEIYTVTVNGTPVSYICKVSQGAVWTVIQYRRDGSVSFHDKLWTDYEKGFGSLSNEFWLGLKEIHRLTSQGLTVLRIQLGFSGNTEQSAQYSSFSVAGPETNYQLAIGGYSGDAGDMMLDPDPDVYLNGMKFSTIDRDNDLSSQSCSVLFTGAWWYNRCALSNINGKYGNIDFAWGDHAATLTRTMMLIKKP